MLLLVRLALLLVTFLVVSEFAHQDPVLADPPPGFSLNVTHQLNNKGPGVSADSTSTTTISGSLNIGFPWDAKTAPQDSTVKPGPGNPAFNGANDPAIGEIVGTISASVRLGLTNNACNAVLTVPITLMNATVANDAGNLIAAIPQNQAGTAGTLERMWTDDGSAPTASLPAPGGIPINGLPAHIERYPSFLNTLLTPPGGTPVQPLARYAGAKNVAGTVVTVNILVFAPGALAAFGPPNPFANLRDPKLGVVMVTVLNDPTQKPAPSAITDFCTPWDNTLQLFGQSKQNPCIGVTTPPCNTSDGINTPTPGAPGKIRYENPTTPGTRLWISFAHSQRDADGDGIENPLDPCPNTADTYDHRTGTGADSDSDGIPDVCDTNGNGSTDSDLDGWQNRGDNCPQNSNPTNDETELSTSYASAAKRGGPQNDEIGDACDPNPSSADGVFFSALSLTAICIGGTDTDNDGWCNSGSTGMPADPDDGNASKTPEDYDLVFPMGVAHSGSGTAPPMREPAQVCNDGIDNDGDTLVDLMDAASGNSSCRPKGVLAHPGFPTCPAAGCEDIDSDGDGFVDEVERHVGTDALGRCELGAVPTRSTDWPSDFISGGVPNSTDKIVVTDLTSFLAPTRRLDTSPSNPNFNVRWDLVPGPGLFGNWINVADLTALIAGASGFPPMFSGAKAFNGPACTAHPAFAD